MLDLIFEKHYKGMSEADGEVTYKHIKDYVVQGL